MDKRQILHRITAILVFAAVMVSIFTYRLMEYQIVRGSEFLEQASTTTTIKMAITAARGEIVDRYGRVLATNRVGYNIQLNRLYLDDENLNERLIQLMKILNTSGEEWTDNLPVTKSQPYTLAENRREDIDKLKETIGLAAYATSENVWDKLVERYGLADVPQEYRRAVAGVRYEMEIRDYSDVTPYCFATDVSMRTVNTIKEQSMTLTGVDIIEEAIRYYPDGTIMPHIIGSVGPIYKEEWEQLKKDGYDMNDIIGKSGLEKAFEEQLRGTDGVMEVERAKDGSIISTRITKEPIPGKTLVLTIDRDLQQAAQDALVNQIQYIETLDNEGGKGASMVVVDMSGGVLACATYPSYDLNLFNQNYAEYAAQENNPLFNRALNGLYRPGSAFKTVVGLAGLLCGEITADTEINCNGVYGYWSAVGFTPSCLQHNHSGYINVERALQDSCNIFFYDVGRRIGYEEFNRVASTLGLGVKTGVEVPEQAGNLSSPEIRHQIIENQLANGVAPANTSEEWQEGNVVQAAIGQMDTSITPIQLATYAAALANRGTRYRTHFVKSLYDYDYNPDTVQETVPEILGSIENVNNAFETVEAGMIRASFYGTLRDSLKDYPYTIATKTGTAQVTKDTFNATMVAYGPTDNPELAIGIVVENCSNSYRLANGVKSVFDAYYLNKAENMKPTPNNVLLE